MQVTASMVKELRDRTGAGMMECKKALVETDGDIDAAIENMRKSGQAKADNKAGRIAAEGLISVALSADGKTAAMVEVNCETDFVAKEDEFKSFVDAVTRRALEERVGDAEALGVDDEMRQRSRGLPGPRRGVHGRWRSQYRRAAS